MSLLPGGGSLLHEMKNYHFVFGSISYAFKTINVYTMQIIPQPQVARTASIVKSCQKQNEDRLNT